jgi:hypothetical protein
VDTLSGTALRPAQGLARRANRTTDNVQQGDQTTPDVPGATDPAEAGAPDAAGAAGSSSAKKLAAAQTAAPAATAETPGTEVAGTEAPGTETPGTETPGSESSVSDGPGGHADPAGSNVDHQFQGNE